MVIPLNRFNYKFKYNTIEGNIIFELIESFGDYRLKEKGVYERLNGERIKIEYCYKFDQVSISYTYLNNTITNKHQIFYALINQLNKEGKKLIDDIDLQKEYDENNRTKKRS